MFYSLLDVFEILRIKQTYQDYLMNKNMRAAETFINNSPCNKIRNTLKNFQILQLFIQYLNYSMNYVQSIFDYFDQLFISRKL